MRAALAAIASLRRSMRTLGVTAETPLDDRDARPLVDGEPPDLEPRVEAGMPRGLTVTHS